jgi:hypothetical protein
MGREETLVRGQAFYFYLFRFFLIIQVLWLIIIPDYLVSNNLTGSLFTYFHFLLSDMQCSLFILIPVLSYIPSQPQLKSSIFPLHASSLLLLFPVFSSEYTEKHYLYLSQFCKLFARCKAHMNPFFSIYMLGALLIFIPVFPVILRCMAHVIPVLFYILGNLFSVLSVTLNIYVSYNSLFFPILPSFQDILTPSLPYHIYPSKNM